MNNIVLGKFFNVLTTRPSRLIKKDFFLRLKRSLWVSFIYKKLPDSSKPRIYFDVTLLSLYDNRTGVQRVVRSVLEELKSAVTDKYEIVLVSCSTLVEGFYVLSEDKKSDKRRFKLSGFKIAPKEGDVFLSLEQAFVEHIVQEQVFEKMRSSGCRIIMTVYDLLPIQIPHCFPVEVKSIYENWLLSTSRYAEFLCDSRTVETDLINYLSSRRRKPEAIYWFYPGSNFLKNVSSTGISSEQSCYIQQTKKFKFNFLMVGTIEPRKGHKTVLDLFTKLWKEKNEDISLTFIGKEGWMVEELLRTIKTSENYQKRLFWFNNATDEFLDLCYSLTDAVIIASLNEGYGLPLIEASQHNCRIIANDIPVFREVAPQGCYFLNLSHPDTAIKQMRNWLKAPPPPSPVIRKQSWKDSTLQILTKTKII